MARYFNELLCADHVVEDWSSVSVRHIALWPKFSPKAQVTSTRPGQGRDKQPFTGASCYFTLHVDYCQAWFVD